MIPVALPALAWTVVLRLQLVFAVLLALFAIGGRARGVTTGLRRTVGRKLVAFYVIIHLYLAAVLVGGAWFTVLFLLTSLLAGRELAAAFLPRGADGRWFRAICFCAIVAAFAVPASPGAWVLAASFVALAVPVLVRRVAGAHENVAATALVVALAAALPLYFVRLREVGIGAALFLFVVVVVNDAFSEAAGRLFGRRGWFTAVSPNKTLEGAIGGALASLAASFLFAPLLPLSPAVRALLALLIAVAGNLGDLVFSALKRSVGQKDFDTVLPAHGGILDRMDSLFYSAPVFHYVVQRLLVDGMARP